MFLEEMYENLQKIDAKEFYQIETECYIALSSLPAEKRPPCVTAFLAISDWFSTSLRETVRYFYNVYNMEEIQLAFQYVKENACEEMAHIFASGIHDYNHPKYAKNFDYPKEWIEGADKIDVWIRENEAYIMEWERNLLIDNRETICALWELSQMHLWKTYVYKRMSICGVSTYIIYPQHYHKVIKVLNLNALISLPLLEIVEKVKTVKLYPAVVYLRNNTNRFWWFPILCYKNGEEFYHVYYHGGWSCRACWADNGSVIMPLVESDAFYYRATKNHYPPVPEIFHKVNCRKCGKPLQNHLLMVEEENR